MLNNLIKRFNPHALTSRTYLSIFVENFAVVFFGILSDILSVFRTKIIDGQLNKCLW